MEQSKTSVRRRVRAGSSGRKTEQRGEQERSNSAGGARRMWYVWYSEFLRS